MLLDSGELLSLIESYYHRVGDKACCFEDLKSYTPSLSEEERSQWIKFLESLDVSLVIFSITTEIVCAQSLFQDSIPNICRMINIFKLRRDSLSEADLSPELETARAGEYFKAYVEGLPFGKDLPETEQQPADDLAILAAMAYVSVWHHTKSEEPLFNAAAILEYGLSKSKQAFQMRILLVRIYQLLGTQISPCRWLAG